MKTFEDLHLDGKPIEEQVRLVHEAVKLWHKEDWLANNLSAVTAWIGTNPKVITRLISEAVLGPGKEPPRE